jgi:hypothetical protein
LLAVHFAAALAAAQGADDLTWPRSATAGADTLTIYQPQIEQWNGAEIAGQAAVSIQTGEAPPLYGVARLSATAEMDKAARVMTIRDIRLARVAFATAPEKDAAYLDGFRKLLPAGAKTVALDKLEGSFALTETVKRQLALNRKSDAPAIIFTTVPTILVLVDGPPALQTMAGLNVERVLNTRALIVKLNGLFFLTAMNYWYEAAAIEGPWAPTDEPPAILASVKQAATAARQVDLMASVAGLPRAEPPALRVSTVPAELIQTAGPPQMLPVEGAFLLRVRNTADSIFVDLNTNLHYVQVSGRWYRARSLYYGPWEAVPADSLPADFAKLPAAAEPATPPAPPVFAAQPQFPPPAAIVTPPDTYAVQQAPPPPIEVIPACPSPEYVWTGGYWDWGAGGWIWIGGRWGIGRDVGPIGVWFGPGYGHFRHFGHGWGRR